MYQSCFLYVLTGFGELEKHCHSPVLKYYTGSPEISLAIPLYPFSSSIKSYFHVIHSSVFFLFFNESTKGSLPSDFFL